MRRSDVNMLSGSITKGLLAISLPVMIMNVLASLFNVIDMTILKTFDPGDGIAVGAVGVCGSLITLITGLVIGIASGSNVVIAKNIGRQDPEGVSRAVGASVALSIVSGLTIGVIGIVGAEVFLRWNNCPDALMDQATVYFRLYFAGVPVLMVDNFCSAILRATGDTRRPMFFSITSGALKVVLTFAFAAIFRMGVVGVAIASVLSWATTATMYLVTLIRHKGLVRLYAKHIRLYKQEMKQILHIGVPAGLQRGMYAVANVVITATVNSFGPAATTGISIANNYDGILYNLVTAPAIAVMPYVSQNIGAGNIKRAKQSVWSGILIVTALGATFGALSASFSVELSSIMSSDPAVIAYSRQKMIIISSTYFICGINDIIGYALRGMGRPVAATVATMVFMCALRFVWVYLIFPLVPTMTFLYLVWPVGWTLSIISLLFVFFPTIRKLAKAQSSAPLTAE